VDYKKIHLVKGKVFEYHCSIVIMYLSQGMNWQVIYNNVSRNTNDSFIYTLFHNSACI
jgi:hypothetical protein